MLSLTRRRPAITSFAAACGLALACFITSRCAADSTNPDSTRATANENPTQIDFSKIGRQASDSTQAKEAAATLRGYLAGKPDSNYVPYARVMLVEALMTSRAPTAELLQAMDRAEKVLPNRPETRVAYYASLARALAQRGVALDRALRYANRAVALCPETGEMAQLRSLALGALGEVQLRLGKPDLAAVTLAKAIPYSPDSQTVLTQLGAAYAKSGRTAAAIDAYLRAATVFAAYDSSALPPLRVQWKKQHGSLAGLDARVASLRAASLKRVALDPHAVPNPQAAPSWRLPDLDENIHDLASYKGKVLVMDFWGSWCGPCRQELPLIEAMYQRYKGNPKVAFVGINWERAQDAEEHRSLARAYVRSNKLSFPVMYDHERNAVTSYQIEGFPTVFLIDREGMLRYVNVGFDPHVDQILQAQIESLLD